MIRTSNLIVWVFSSFLRYPEIFVELQDEVWRIHPDFTLNLLSTKMISIYA